MKSQTLLLLSFICLVSPSISAADQTTSKQPNVVVFLVDDMGIMDTSLPFLTDDTG